MARGPLLITARRLEARWPKTMGRNTPRPATVPVFLDSGAFTEIDKHGAWTWALRDFVTFVRRACAALETVRWVGIQDWMCEPFVLRKTGLSIEEHQRRTVASYLDLCAAPEVPWLATLQGYTLADYLRCADLYARAGVDLAALPLVGLGSVCRRNGTAELVGVLDGLARELPDVRWHGYGVKSEGVLQSCAGLRSVDSDAGSSRGRHAEGDLRRALGLPVDAPALAMTTKKDVRQVSRFSGSPDYRGRRPNDAHHDRSRRPRPRYLYPLPEHGLRRRAGSPE